MRQQNWVHDFDNLLSSDDDEVEILLEQAIEDVQTRSVEKDTRHMDSNDSADDFDDIQPRRSLRKASTIITC